MSRSQTFIHFLILLAIIALVVCCLLTRQVIVNYLNSTSTPSQSNTQVFGNAVGYGSGTSNSFMTLIGSSGSQVESDSQQRFPAGDFRLLRMKLDPNAAPTSGQLDVTLRVNGAPTALSCSMTAAGLCDTGTTTVSIADDSLVSVEMNHSLVGPTLTYMTYTVLFEPQ